MIFKGRNFISLNDYTNEEIVHILKLALKFESNPVQNILDGKVVASLFFEPSTRTRLSFESASNKIGAKVIGFSDVSSTSVKKGETLHDTIKMVESYADIIVMRHPQDGAARLAGDISKVPIVNAGDGANQHPSQTMLDIFSILKTQGKIENLDIALVGDLKYGRTVHSLCETLSRFGCNFYFVSPKELRMPKSIKFDLEKKGINFVETKDLQKVIPKVDILYMTRIQKERFSDLMEYEKVKNSFILDVSMLEGTRSNMKIFHPLPRVNEINANVDSSKHAYYFTQASNGIFARQAILSLLLGVKE
ncbi:MAG: aspartate carbamoyltransferase [Nanoarchaeota archaeon]|nr:aspartate carbamoyltransferase [Nanoarchaeota archaeon]